MSRVVEVVDRSGFAAAMLQRLELSLDDCAMVTIDVQRGSLDPSVASMPVPEPQRSRALDGNHRMVKLGRDAGIPVIHVVTHWHATEIAAQPFEQAALDAGESFTPHARSDFAGHKESGSLGAELMPELGPDPRDIVVDSKRRFDAFYNTNLEGLLRAMGRRTLIIGGINTNTCVQASVLGAYSRDLRSVVVEDAVASAYGEDLHVLALENIRRRLGWVTTLEDLAARLRG